MALVCPHATCLAVVQGVLRVRDQEHAFRVATEGSTDLIQLPQGPGEPAVCTGPISSRLLLQVSQCLCTATKYCPQACTHCQWCCFHHIARIVHLLAHGFPSHITTASLRAAFTYTSGTNRTCSCHVLSHVLQRTLDTKVSSQVREAGAQLQRRRAEGAAVQLELPKAGGTRAGNGKPTVTRTVQHRAPTPPMATPTPSPPPSSFGVTAGAGRQGAPLTAPQRSATPAQASSRLPPAPPTLAAARLSPAPAAAVAQAAGQSLSPQEKQSEWSE